jgi:hypothetical protein
VHGETNLACDRRSRDRLGRRPHANLPSAYVLSFCRRDLHLLRWYWALLSTWDVAVGRNSLQGATSSSMIGTDLTVLRRCD